MIRTHHLPLRRKDAGERDYLVKAGHDSELELREEGSVGIVKGYGSVFNKVDSYGESVMPGAFTKSLKAWARGKVKVIPMLWQHRSDTPVGIWDEYEEDTKGLKLQGQINLETQRGKEAWSDMKMKAVTGLSIGFYEIKADPYDFATSEPRKLYELDLREVSPVTFPALREAQIDTVKARLARGERLTLREFESALREKFRLSRTDAEDIASLGYKTWLSQRDVGGLESESVLDVVHALRGRPALDLPTF